MQLNTVLLLSGGAVQAIQLLVALSILILLHEFGHFFFARLFGTRVEKFYLFFDFLFPFSGVLNFSLFKKKKGDTEYGIGWFPLGGYVKIAGMVDESMDKEAMAKPPQPWEYRSKKAWQRLFIMLGGIIMNILVAMVIYSVVFSVYGETYLLTKDAKYGIMVDSLGESVNLRNGDKILSVDNKPVERFNALTWEILTNDLHSIQIERNGKEMNIQLPSSTVKNVLESKKKGDFIAPRVPAVIGSIEKNSIAEKLKLKVDDSIVAVNGKPIHYFDEFKAAMQANYDKPMTIEVVRNANMLMVVTTVIPKDSILGIGAEGLDRYFQLQNIHYNPIQAIGKGFSYTWEQFGKYITQFKLIKQVNPNKSLGGIVSFGKMFTPTFDMHDFLMLTAFVSIILAFMNLLPIPGLDGGYVIFLLFELVTGKKVSEKVMERATSVGLVLLLGLMLYANGLDILRLFKK